MVKGQQQFLDVIDRDQAEKRFQAALRLSPLDAERVSLATSLGRVLSEDIVAQVDVPSFDRSNFDGFAVRAADTFPADEEEPVALRLLGESIATAVVPRCEVVAGTAAGIATGGMLPRGGDAIVMVEYADVTGKELLVRRAVTPGFGVSFAGTDVACGETILRAGDVLSSRETGVLAAIGLDSVPVLRRPRVAIISTGDEIISPGQKMSPGLIFDSNARVVADAVRELGAEPLELGIVHDDLEQLRRILSKAIAAADVVLLSGGTSKGEGDLSYKAVSQLTDPGIVAHGVALKPGKPICLAATNGKPVVILPGFPTSAIFTFHEFVAPVIRKLAGRPHVELGSVTATMATRVNSVIGRTEYNLVRLFQSRERREADSYRAFPMGKGSGSVTTFSQADGFVTIDRHTEIVDAGQRVTVRLLSQDVRLADLTVVGSHCTGLDFLLGKLQQQGLQTKFLAVGSTAGLEAIKQNACDLAGIHLYDPATERYNTPFLTENLELIEGYRRMQGIVFRRDDPRFAAADLATVLDRVKTAEECLMVNRNQGSGTRILIDRLLSGSRPEGYAIQSKNHNAVAAAVVQGRADWGVAIRNVAEQQQLGFLPVTEECYDFVLRRGEASAAITAFRTLLADPEVRDHLRGCGFTLTS